MKGEEELEGLGVSISELLRQRVAMGNKKRFWEDKWVGQDTLKDRYNRLYVLGTNKSCLVAEKVKWDEGTWSWVWNWRARLRGRAAGQFIDLLATLHDFTPKENTEDSWIWAPTSDGIFTISCLSKTVNKSLAASLHYPTVWIKMLAEKVNIFPLRAVNGMLPMQYQLQRCGMDIQTPCPLFSAHAETVDHTLVSCHFTTRIWFAVSRWCNTDLSCFSSFSNVLGGSTINQVQRNKEPS